LISFMGYAIGHNVGPQHAEAAGAGFAIEPIRLSASARKQIATIIAFGHGPHFYWEPDCCSGFPLLTQGRHVGVRCCMCMPRSPKGRGAAMLLAAVTAYLWLVVHTGWAAGGIGAS